ncbi:hypothetical protein GX51_03050 [Blastomyces parvus]|uniref:GABA permease n=1 Tax=Blastomyces parvus TaxID=2060905 RepID=A0A2B7X8V3_9EURO|nr:hypothetical protein GX51_03050 [Blastomyces parvus]
MEPLIAGYKLPPVIGAQGIGEYMSVSNPNNPELIDETDVELLATMGYKQELRRQYSSIHIFAIAFSILALLPSMAASLPLSLPAGPAGMVWGWLTASGFIFIVGLAIADLASSLPTSGGLYWWTHYFAKEQFKNPLSFLVGYSSAIGLVGGTCSVDYGFAKMILSIVSICSTSKWTASSPIVFGVFVACVITHAILATFASKIMHKIQTAFIVANVVLIMATVIALPIGKSRTEQGLNSMRYVFFHQENFTTWPSGWTFMLAWLSPIWSIGGVDSCVYMSEEAKDARRSVPHGILGSVGACWVLGFICICIIAACMNPDIGSLLQSPFGQPMAQIYYDALGKESAIVFMALMSCLQYFMGLSLLLAASRQSWAFARDGALPFSTFFRVVSTRINCQPVRTVWGCAGSAIVVGLICLIHPIAAKALFSLGVAANGLSWAITIFCRVAWGRKKFTPGPFYTGILSTPIAITALIYLAFAILLCMFPAQGPHPTAKTMNYTVVVNVTLWGGALLYYFLFARKWFNGPQTTLK